MSAPTPIAFVKAAIVFSAAPEVTPRCAATRGLVMLRSMPDPGCPLSRVAASRSVRFNAPGVLAAYQIETRRAGRWLSWGIRRGHRSRGEVVVQPAAGLADAASRVAAAARAGSPTRDGRRPRKGGLSGCRPAAAPAAAARLAMPRRGLPRCGYPSREQSFTARTGQEARIGRSPENDIVVNDPTVSRQHSVVRSGAAGWEYAQAGSAPTFSGDQQVAVVAVDRPVDLALGSPDGPVLHLEPVTASVRAAPVPTLEDLAAPQHAAPPSPDPNWRLTGGSPAAPGGYPAPGWAGTGTPGPPPGYPQPAWALPPRARGVAREAMTSPTRCGSCSRSRAGCTTRAGGRGCGWA